MNWRPHKQYLSGTPIPPPPTQKNKKIQFTMDPTLLPTFSPMAEAFDTTSRDRHVPENSLHVQLARHKISATPAKLWLVSVSVRTIKHIILCSFSLTNILFLLRKKEKKRVKKSNISQYQICFKQSASSGQFHLILGDKTLIPTRNSKIKRESEEI